LKAGPRGNFLAKTEAGAILAQTPHHYDQQRHFIGHIYSADPCVSIAQN
jgi:hypothetical protein